MSSTTIDHPPPTNADASPNGVVPLLAAACLGGAVAVALGTYARVHNPTGQSITSFGFDSVLAMKAWITTVGAILAVFQLASALWMWGRLPGAGRAPGWVGPAHRWSGTAAFVSTLPVAYHCLWSLGFQDGTGRVLVHSLLGCAFYGIFTTKMLAVHSRRMPDWAVPLVGAALVVTLAAIWWTSSLWYFRTFGFPGT